MSSEGSNVAAGWYPDPSMANTQRYWDGTQWTHHVHPMNDPLPPTQQYATQPYGSQQQSGQPHADQLHDAPQSPTQQYPAQQYPAQQYPAQPLQVPVAAGPPKSGMSTALKVVLGLGFLFLLMLGGCVALISLAASNLEPAVSDSGQPGFADQTAAAIEEAPAVEEPSRADAIPSQGFGSREAPLPYDEPVEITWNTFGDADGSVWSTTIGPPRDITDEVLADNQFNTEPPDGVRFVGFDVELVLLQASKEPLSPGFNFSWELLGGSTAAAYEVRTIETEFFGCGVVPGSFDDFAEVFVSGSLAGTVCIPLPEEDLNHPDTRVALHFIDDNRAVFGN